MLYGSLSYYIFKNKISLTLLAEFFDAYGIPVHILHPDDLPRISTIDTDGVTGTIIPVKKDAVGLRCWTQEDAVASALEKLREVYATSDYTNIMAYDNQEIHTSMVNGRTAYQAHLVVYACRAFDGQRVKELRVS